MALSDEFLQELRMKTDIESLISSYVSLRRRGRVLNGLCPFHNEKSPSFTVYPETQSFYCFGCGAGGDAITFVRRAENLDYVEAVKLLAQRAGMSMPEDGVDESLSRQRKRLLEANREAARYFHQCLLSSDGAQALSYFTNRGLTMTTIRHFGLGYAPDSWDSLYRRLSSLGYKEDELVMANLLQRSRKSNRCYDNFRNRVMIPIIDLRGNVIAFGGRVLDDSKPKYINTSDTLVYKKSQGVFALNFAKSHVQDYLILAEGYMDVIALHQAGFENAVACLGTALTEEQARMISRYTGEVILSYDADNAGQAAARRAISIFSRTGVKVRVLKLSGGKDPDEIIRTFGKERFKQLLEQAENDVEYRIEKEKSRFDVTTPDGKVDYLKAACGVLATLNEPVQREIYAGRLAEDVGVDKLAIINQTEKMRKQIRRNQSQKQFKEMVQGSAGRNDTINPQRAEHLRCAKAEEGLIALLMLNPDYYSYVGQRLKPEDFVTDFNRRVYIAVTGLIIDKKNVDLTSVSGFFTPEEMGRIAGIQTLCSKSSNTLEECNDYISVILEEKEKMALQKPSEMSAEGISRAFERLAAKKNKGSKHEEF